MFISNIYAKLSIGLLLLSFSLLFSSCNEKPTSITYSLLYDTISISAVSSDTMNFFEGNKTVYVPTKIFNGGAIFVGGYNGYRAASLLRFKESNLPDTLASWLTQDMIDSVNIVLPISRYVLGDSLNPNFSFKIYLVNQFWSNAITWDSLFNDWTPNSKVEPNPIGYYAGKIELKDSMPNLTIPLQSSFITDWLKKNKDSIPIWGILLAPESGCRIIHQIRAQYITVDTVNIHPKIIVKYRYKDGTPRVWYINSAIDCSVTQVPPLSDSTSLVIQGGYSYRALLQFNFSAIPKFSAIHYAQLEFTIDESKTIYGNLGSDTVFTGSYFEKRSLDSVPIFSFYGRREGNKVTFPKVSTPIELWLKGNGKGELVFYPYGWNEIQRLDRIAFYGINTSDPRLRPKLKLIYSKRRP